MSQTTRTSFAWKRKAGGNFSRFASAAFENEAMDDNDNMQSLMEHGKIDWLSLQSIHSHKIPRLEDAIGKSLRLQSDGITLAESERYWEAIKKWDEAISLRNTSPDVAKLYEMKAQALLLLLELHPAATAASKAISCDPTWWVGYQTLGRVHLSMGEVRMAVKDFTRAIHLNPRESELWTDDLHWALSLLQQKQQNLVELQKNVERVEVFEEERGLKENDDADHHRKEVYDSLQTVPKGYVQMRDSL